MAQRGSYHLFYCAFHKHAYGKDAFTEELKKARNTVFKLSEDNEDYRIVHDNLSDMAKVTSGLTYQKGAWITHMLCNYIGEEAFHKGIRDYYARYYNGNATTSDLRMAFERASGKDLSQFFQQWLFQGGNIKLKGTWSYNSDDEEIIIELQQLQPTTYTFNMPLEVGISNGEHMLQQIETIQLDKRRIKVAIPSKTIPEKIELDPYTKLLAQWTFTYKE